MKKRLIATVLAAILLLLALPVSASDATKSLGDIIDKSKTSWINITESLTISEYTVIPKDVTVNILPGVTVLLQKGVTLTVKGTLNNFGVILEHGKITTDGGTYRKLTAYDWVYYYQYLYGQYPGYIYLPDYPYPPYYWYPGFDYEDIDWPWPIFLPDQPYLPQPPKDSEDISNYYYYLLWLYQQDLIDKDEWDDFYPYYYYYWNYNPIVFTCATPTASVKSGSTVEFGSTVTLSTTTQGADIYYTTDGSTPDTTAKLYTGPIKINKTEMVIKAIAVKDGYKDSSVATFSYKTKASVSFTDLGAHADALIPSLTTLVQAKVISDGTTLNPDGSVSYEELLSWLTAVGANTNKAVIDETFIADKDALTYEDFAYVCYRVLLATPGVITPPKQSAKVVLGKLKYGSEVTTTPSMVRAGVMSLVEAELFYRSDFHPKSPATRAYAFYLLGEVYNKIN